jgi:hypothetical protein
VSAAANIVILGERIAPHALAGLARASFGDMVKFVVDVERRVMAVGGELHADGEALLLEAGSEQATLWGGNYFPGRGPAGCIEYTSLINIRPSQGNRSMNLVDPALRERMRAIVFELLGEGEPLP